MNRVSLVGRVTKNPELRYTPSGIATCNLSIAIDRLPDKDGNKKTDFIPVVVWNKQAENVKKYVSRGSLVSVEGKIATRSYEGKDGQKKYVTEVISERVQFLSSSKKEDNTKLTAEQIDNTPIENNPFDDVPW